MSLTAKIGLALLLVLAAALGMTTVLNYLRFEQTLRTVLIQRIQVVANETGQDLQSGVDLGLRLESMENLGEIIARRLAMSDEIAAVRVVDCVGVPIAEGTRNPDILKDVNQSTGDVSNAAGVVFRGQAAVLDKTIYDSLGQCAGHLVLVADLGPLHTRLENALGEMSRSAGFGMLAIIPILGLLVVLMRRRHRVFDALNADVERAIHGQSATGELRARDLLTQSEMEMVETYRDIREKLSETSLEQGNSSPETGARP